MRGVVMSSYEERVGNLENELGFVIAEIEEYTTRVEELRIIQSEIKEGQ